MSLKSIILATATLCSVSSAHIIMAQPIPYSVDKIDNSPITASQFPCKSNLGFTVSKMNTMAVGEQQTIKFKGTAVHGGGSCQLSVTTDTEPTANSTFKVIKSIEGGCPGVDGSTNEYQFEIPDSIPSGKATFAWTWFSKMSGAPELYMNCAPIEVTGGASDTSKFDALPDMFKANIGEGCTTAQNFATKFPNPGAVVQMGNTNDQEAPSGSCGASGASPSPSGGAGYPVSSVAGGQPSAAPSAAPSSAGGNNGQYTPPAGAGTSSAAATSAAAYPTGPAGGASSAASATSEAAVTSPATSAAASPTSPAGEASGAVTSAATSAAAYPTGSAGGVFAPGASSAAPVASTQTTLVTVTGTPSVPSATVPLGTAPLGTGSSGAVPTSAPAAGGNTCPTDGAILCNGPTQFGICDHGNVVYQPVAAGTTCSNGSIQKRGYHARLTRVRRNRSLFSHAHRN